MALACLPPWQQLEVDRYCPDSCYDSSAKMRFSSSFKLVAVGLLDVSSLVTALPTEGARKDKRLFEERDGVTHTLFEHADTGVKIDFVTNSDICEMTPGINQYSGYFSVRTSASKSASALRVQAHVPAHSSLHTVLSNTKLWNGSISPSPPPETAVTDHHP